MAAPRKVRKCFRQYAAIGNWAIGTATPRTFRSLFRSCRLLSTPVVIRVAQTDMYRERERVFRPTSGPTCVDLLSSIIHPDAQSCVQ